MMLANYLLDNENRSMVNEYFNRNYYHQENREPSYRSIYIIEKPNMI